MAVIEGLLPQEKLFSKYITISGPAQKQMYGGTSNELIAQVTLR